MFDVFTKPLVDEMTVFDHMKQVGNTAGVFAEFMSKATFIISTPRLLDQVVQLIDKINMNDRDTKGDLYEYMLSKIASAGTNGQFRTPRHIIKMMVDMTQPKKDDVICDPSSGTAGFLVAAGEYFRGNHEDWFLDKSFRDHFNNEMFNGVEIDDTMIRIGAMNLQLHGIENPNLIKNDALSESLADIRSKYSLILANPPFKGSLDYDGVENSILKMVKSKKTELLFLGLMLRMLKTGGRCAVIVPDGVLFGSSKAHKQIRQELIENHKLDAVISMPSGVFKPYAGVSTAVLFFTKTGTGGTDNVWFYDMHADGYSLDDKRSEIKDNDIPEIVDHFNYVNSEYFAKMHSPKGDVIPVHDIPENLGWDLFNSDTCHHDYSDRTAKSFLVPFDEIKKNNWDLSINRYKEIVYEEIVYAAPSEIIKNIETLDTERNQALAALKEMLG
jgi:type I restriction enzyme M protein